MPSLIRLSRELKSCQINLSSEYLTCNKYLVNAQDDDLSSERCVCFL